MSRFSCTHCDYKSDKKFNFQRHMKTNHGEDLVASDTNLTVAPVTHQSEIKRLRLDSHTLSGPENSSEMLDDVASSAHISVDTRPREFESFVPYTAKKPISTIPNSMKVHELEERIDMLEDAIRRLVTANQRVSRALQF